MTSAVATSSRFDIGRVFTRTFGVIGANFGPFFILAFLLEAVPTAVLNSFTLHATLDYQGSDQWVIRLVGALVQIALASVLTAALVRGTIVDLDGRKASLGDCLSVGLKYAAPAFVMAWIATICYAIGFVLLIVPGVILALAWSAATPVLVIERKGVFGSFGRSAQLTNGHRWAILGLWICAALMVIALSIPFGMLSFIVSMILGGNIYVKIVITCVLAALEAIFFAVMSTAAYAELRGSRDGVSITDLASVFD
jgi:hypothetical protein